MRDTFLHRLMGAAMLDTATYEEIEADPRATSQALVVVVASSLAAGIGAQGAIGGREALAFFASASVPALLVWAAFAMLTFEVGARILPTPATRSGVGELLRTLGFAATPGLIQVFAVLPGAKVPVFTVAIVWAVAASVVAVRQSLDYPTTGRAIAVCALGLSMALAIAIVLGLLFGPSLSGF